VSSGPPKKSTSFACICISDAFIPALISSDVGGPSGGSFIEPSGTLLVCCPLGVANPVLKFCDMDLNPLNIELMPSEN